MNKGFTMVEILIGAIIGIFISYGMIRFHHYTNISWQSLRQRVTVTENLQMAHDELGRRLQACEPEFWARFPRKHALVHQETASHKAVSVGRTCSVYGKTGCVTIWDIRPDSGEPILYQLEKMDHTWEPLLVPFDNRHPVGPDEGIGAMSVFLLSSGDQVFPLLASQVQDNQVHFFPTDQQPWVLPQEFDPSGYAAVHLGKLEVHHFTRKRDRERGGVLMAHPYELSHDGWRSRRGSSSYTYLHHLAWEEESELDEYRLLLIGQAPRARYLAMHQEVGGQMFDREVHFVSMGF